MVAWKIPDCDAKHDNGEKVVPYGGRGLGHDELCVKTNAGEGSLSTNPSVFTHA